MEKDLLGLTKKQPYIYGWMFFLGDIIYRQAKGVSIKVHGVQREGYGYFKKAKLHLLEYMAMQMEDLDYRCLRRNLEKC